jgi:hypothetical protein
MAIKRANFSKSPIIGGLKGAAVEARATDLARCNDLIRNNDLQLEAKAFQAGCT